MRNVCETAFIRAATTTANSMQWNKKKVWKKNFVQQHCARASAVDVGGEVTPRTCLACLVACAKNQFATKAEKKYSTLFDVNACMPGIFPSFIGLENMQPVTMTNINLFTALFYFYIVGLFVHDGRVALCTATACTMTNFSVPFVLRVELLLFVSQLQVDYITIISCI